jgi:hypothetical protein
MPGPPGARKTGTVPHQQNFRDEEWREEKSLNRFATEETKAHQSQRGAGAEYRCQYR